MSGRPLHLGRLDGVPGRGVPYGDAKGRFGGRGEGLPVRESKGRYGMRMRRKRKKGEWGLERVGINGRENCVGECESHTEIVIKPETKS